LRRLPLFGYAAPSATWVVNFGVFIAAAAVPDEEVEHLAFGVLGPSPLEGYAQGNVRT
jgi:hypothetical protein